MELSLSVRMSVWNLWGTWHSMYVSRKWLPYLRNKITSHHNTTISLYCLYHPLICSAMKLLNNVYIVSLCCWGSGVRFLDSCFQTCRIRHFTTQKNWALLTSLKTLPKKKQNNPWSAVGDLWARLNGNLLKFNTLMSLLHKTKSTSTQAKINLLFRSGNTFYHLYGKGLCII